MLLKSQKIGFLRRLLWDIGKYRRRSKSYTLSNIRYEADSAPSASALSCGESRKRIVAIVVYGVSISRAAAQK